MKRVLITGASRGIGYAIADRLLAESFEVIGTSRKPNSIPIEHSNFSSVHLDLIEISLNQDLLSKLVETCGEIDVLILNAGQGRFGSLEEFSSSQINEQIQLNLIAQIHLVRAFIKSFKQRRSGDVIFIGSESGLAGGKMGSIYSAAKFGLRGFSQALRQECANNNIRVGLINPGMVASSFFDDLSFQPGSELENTILPEQVADAVDLVLRSGRNMVWDEINLSPLKKVINKKKN